MADVEQAMGLDIGGSRVKAAVVDLGRGELITERVRLKTPRPATPEAVLETAARIRERLDWRGPVGCGFPGAVRRGKITSAPNLDPSRVGRDLAAGLRQGLGVEKVAFGNDADADAAGLAEVRFGAGRGVEGTVIVVTLGTGIGTAVFNIGVLLPGTELGHLQMDGRDAEELAAESARDRNDWSWKRWGRNVDRYLARLEYLLGVDLFILGGGACKGHKFVPHLEEVGCEVVVASMGNLAGIVGAALLVGETERSG